MTMLLFNFSMRRIQPTKWRWNNW